MTAHKKHIPSLLGVLYAGWLGVVAAAGQTADPPSPETAIASGEVAPEAPDFSQIATGQIEKEAVSLTRAKKYAEATPYLRELLRRLSDSTQDHIRAKLEGFRYFLALGLLTDQDWNGAAAAFQEFFKEHPANQRQQIARDLYGDALAAGNRHKEAAEQYQLLLQMRMPSRDALKIMDKMVQSLLASQQWEDAIPVLAAMLEKAPREGRQREIIATALTRCYIETNQPGKVLEVLPGLLSRAPRARLSVEFNLALLEAGDRLLMAEEPLLALLFYQLVLPYDRLQEWNEQLLQQNEETAAASQATANLEGWLETRRMARILETEKALLEAAPDYTPALGMRIARTYFSNNRIYEAMWSFWNLFLEHPDSEFGAEACYASYALATQLEQFEKAKEAGFHYLSAYPGGPFWNDVSLGLAQVLLRTREYETLDDFVDTVLTANPEHPEAGMLLYMQGFGRFQREMFAEARQSFDRVMTQYPESSMSPAALYWKAMTWLFSEEYGQAESIFQTYLERHPNSEFSEDATFRAAVCRFAEEDYPAAATGFKNFLQEYPTGPLSGEAHNLLGDSLGATGQLDEAEKSYRQARIRAAQQGQIDHATFQIGKIMEAEGRWTEMEEFFAGYLDQYGTKGDYTQAIHRRGFALEALEEKEKAKRIYWDAIERYGRDPAAQGLDLILDTYLDMAGEEGILQAATAAQAVADRADPDTRGYFLRLQSAMHRGGHVEDMPVLQAGDIPLLSPAGLAWVGETSQDSSLSEAALNRLLEEFPRSLWALNGWIARGEKLAEQGSYKEAEAAFLEARRLQPMTPQAGLATLRMGDMRRQQDQKESAVIAYEEVLQVRDWRGPLWPRALYAIGETYLQAGELQLAYPYFQRIFLLYRNYPEWAARAYLQCADISLKLGLKGDALRTLAEMLEQSDFESLPELLIARQRFEEIE